jgi:diguanylate cyclase (GGDEF)-like protein/PAS domain S-box-containing protein
VLNLTEAERPIPMPSDFSDSPPRTALLTVFAFLASLVLFFLYMQAENANKHANEQRINTLLSIDLLRQSSEELTRMARAYVTTADPHERTNFDDVLAIRAGQLARPQLYGDRARDRGPDTQADTAPVGDKLALRELMRRAGLTKSELLLFDRALAKSDALAAIEREAMDMVPEQGPFLGKTKARATFLLNGPEYLRKKDDIMRLNESFATATNQRTASGVRDSERLVLLFRLAYLGAMLISLVALWRSYVGLRRTLGGSSQLLHAYIQEIGHGDLNARIVVPRAMRDSVLAGLAAMQAKLRALEQIRVQAGREIEDGAARLQSMFEASPDAMLMSDAQGVITMANQQSTILLGYPRDELIGQTIETLVPEGARANHVEERDRFTDAGGAARFMNQSRAVTARRKDGSGCEVEIRLGRIRTERGLFFVSTLRDVSERRQAEAQIHALAFFDPLTGLPNRSLLLERLRRATADAGRDGIHGAVLLLGLNNFKSFNDTMGHGMGDILLQQFAERLRASVREDDSVARHDGDQFVVILAGLSARTDVAALHVEVAASQLLAALNAPYTMSGAEHHGPSSMGIVLFKGAHESADNLLTQAMLAMYKAKQAGHNTMKFFDPEMERTLKQRVQLEADLRCALRERQFFLLYQPQVAVDRTLIGCEALVRWSHPQRALVSPAEFIPVAEETRLIVELGRWVLETACEQLAHWAAEPALAALTMAVNVSAQEFRQPDFVANVLAAVKRHGIDPSRLKLELTESLLVDNVNELIAKMHQIKDCGIGFSLDDFGTGYSSLSYLKRMPLDQLKIDQSFVRDMLTNHNDAAIVKSIVALSSSLGMNVIAEGVETHAQQQFLEQVGCLCYQGYYFGRPLALDQFEKMARGTPDAAPEANLLAGAAGTA